MIKYIAGGKDITGALFEIEISDEDFTGTAQELKMGSSPLLRMDDGGRIKGTSLEFSLLSETAGALADLYTTDPFKLKVELKKDSSVIWTGYILREQYSEDYVKPPYAINVTAADGLGILKEIEFDLEGQKTPIELFYAAFNKVHLPLDLAVYSKLIAFTGDGMPERWLETCSFDVTGFAEDYYEMLENLLDTLNAHITQRGNRWVFERVSAIWYDGFLYSNGVYVSLISPVNSSISPIGSLSLSVEPSKRDINFKSLKTYPSSITKNHLFEDNLFWGLIDTTYSSFEGESYAKMQKVTQAPRISQTFKAGQGYSYTLIIDFTSISTNTAPQELGVFLSNNSRYLTNNGWVTNPERIKITTIPTSGEMAERSRTEIKFQASPAHTGFEDDYYLAIRGVDDSDVEIRIYEVSVVITAPQEKLLDATINANATQSASDATIFVSDREMMPNRLNFWNRGGILPTSFKHEFGTASDYDVMIAKDIICGLVINRTRLSGNVKEISDYYTDPQTLTKYFATTYDYDLLNKIVNIELIEVAPHITSLTLAPFVEGSYSQPSTGGTSGGSAGGTGLVLGETELTAYRGDRGKIAYDHSQESDPHFDSSLTKTAVSSHINSSTLHFDSSSGVGKVTRAQAASLVGNLGDGSALTTQVNTNKSDIETLETTVGGIETDLSGKADLNGDITENFAANNITVNKITLNGVELTIESV
jgi:hypothetical protein